MAAARTGDWAMGDVRHLPDSAVTALEQLRRLPLSLLTSAANEECGGGLGLQSRLQRA